jgi:L-amino acid N-acyltransferase YncA
MAITIPQASDLPRIVASYNAPIPGRLATGTAPVTVAARSAWFSDFDAKRPPLWTFRDVPDEALVGWLLQSPRAAEWDGVKRDLTILGHRITTP